MSDDPEAHATESSADSKLERFNFRLSTVIAIMLICGLLMPLVLWRFEESNREGWRMFFICIYLGVILFAVWRWIVGMSREIDES